jgi:primosomal protein N' (replication factor Y)
MTGSQVAEVVVDVRTKALDKTFDYLVPPGTVVNPGHRVFVSFGKQHCQGFVMRVRSEPATQTLKSILAVLDSQPVLTPEMLALCEWLCRRTVCTQLEAIHAVLPSAFKTEHVKQYTASGENPPVRAAAFEEKVWNNLRKSPKTFAQLVGTYGSDVTLLLEQWLAIGAVQEVLGRKDKVGAKTSRLAVLSIPHKELENQIAQRSKRAPKQAALLRAFAEAESIRLAEWGVQPSHPVVKALVEAGLIELQEIEVMRAPVAASRSDEPADRPLTTWQERALMDIERALHPSNTRHFVLHGVTGSGKTEVYLRAIAGCLENGWGAIVLVPEISLTPQMVGRFISRFGEQVAVLHSALSQGEKRDEWVRIRRGEAKIVVGARSAVFAPVENLRLLIVDEEHEPSYKQDETPRYEAREVARWRMDKAGGVTVFGSATPSLQSMHDVETGKAHILSMPTRVNGKPLPPVAVVDMREEMRNGNRSLFSAALLQGLDASIAGGHQAILFLNRRGYASFLLCRNCGEALECGRCDITMTLHRSRNGDWLKCHYCSDTREAPEECPQCAEPAMRSFGVGTQQVEQALHELRPDWRVLRMDVDTTRRKGSHQVAFDTFARGEVDVMIGTQMVAKGLDFPNVSFVGVIAADTMLAVPDYRSAERTFSLLTQVAGRAGRAAVAGHTVIQTYRPDHYAIAAAASHDYGTFYRQERELREVFGYPPFCEITVFLATHAQSHLAEGAAKRFEREVRRKGLGHEVVVLPAVPSGIGRIEDQYRFQVVVKYSQWDAVKESIVGAYHVVREKMNRLGGTCVVDVNAGRI